MYWRTGAAIPARPDWPGARADRRSPLPDKPRARGGGPDQRDCRKQREREDEEEKRAESHVRTLQPLYGADPRTGARQDARKSTAEHCRDGRKMTRRPPKAAENQGVYMQNKRALVLVLAAAVMILPATLWAQHHDLTHGQPAVSEAFVEFGIVPPGPL